jgi:O-antigen biosynthesis protein
VKIVFYTAIIGAYDTIKNPLFIDKNIDYLCFTDNPNLKSRVWKNQPIDPHFFHSDPQRIARFIKTHPHLYLPEHDISIWVDANYQIRLRNYQGFIDLNSKLGDFLSYKHPKRNCCLDEFKVCISSKIDNIKLMEEQRRIYESEGFFNCDDFLFHTAVLFRKNTEENKKINELWWKQISKFSKRDQLSLSYVFWKLQKKPILINKIYGETLRKSLYFTKYKHLKGRSEW